MQGYYSAKLAGRRLERCYDVASARVRRYLEAEIEFVLGRLRPTDDVLERRLGIEPAITTVDDSSVFCELRLLSPKTASGKRSLRPG